MKSPYGSPSSRWVSSRGLLDQLHVLALYDQQERPQVLRHNTL